MKKKMLLRRLTAWFLSVVIMAVFPACGKQDKMVNETDDITFGIDVARYQGTIDWKQVADSGIDFVMIRVGYRAMADGVIVEDVNARYNLQEAAKENIAIGAYFFSTAVSVEEAKEEAAWTADILSGYPVTYPVVYDCEGFNEPESRQYQMTRGERTDVALAFLKTIESLGYEGMFYGSKNDLHYENSWETSRIEDSYKIWVAQYPEAPYPETSQSTYTGKHHMWQYSTEGTIPGISQPVDLNIAYFGYDGLNQRKDRKTPAKAEPSVEALMEFDRVDEQVTAKSETNLRNIPSQGDDSEVVATLKNGEVIQRVAISTNGWSKVIYEGQTCYAVSSYLTTDLAYDAPETGIMEPDVDGIETEFRSVNYQVTAKDVVNLRALPSVEHENADVIAQLNKGEVASCIGISNNGWSKLIYNGATCYAVSSYLTEMGTSSAASQSETDDGIQTQFEPMNDRVTAKVKVNLRSLPSVEDPDCVVVAALNNGDVVTRTGINRDVGWSRVEYNGQVLYCITSYLMSAE